jgi:hypothetical protein
VVREPRVASATVALAGVDVHLVVGVFAVTVDDVFSTECVVLFERLVRSKAVGIDSQRLLLAIGQQESIRLRLSPGSRTAVRCHGRR